MSDTNPHEDFDYDSLSNWEAWYLERYGCLPNDDPSPFADEDDQRRSTNEEAHILSMETGT